MVNFTVNDNNLVIGGNNTFDIKDSLKKMGARWNPDVRAWVFPLHMDTKDLRKQIKGLVTDLKEKERVKKQAAVERERERLAYLATPEGKEATRQQRIADNTARMEEDKQRIARGEAPLYWWINCLECEVVDWHKKCTTCDACADICGFIKNTFRVKGMIRTGD